MQPDQDITVNIIEVPCKEDGDVSREVHAFMVLWQELPQPEDKIRKAIDFMRLVLSSGASPKFKDFWEVRKVCLPIFKEEISSKTRAELWQEYIDLSGEARRLRETLEEQSAFACEQIDLAISALEKDLQQRAEGFSRWSDIAEIAAVSLWDDEKKQLYLARQKELNFLQVQASRVLSLRKEVVRTGMRVRNKNKLLDRLSACGDMVFPRRKELIALVSDAFVQDVEAFSLHCKSVLSSFQIPLHVLRQEIKALQSVAKVLTLHVHGFTETRQKLSMLWDLVREKEQEKKEAYLEKKALQQELLDKGAARVAEFSVLCAGESDWSSLEKKYQELLGEMRVWKLGRMESQMLREKMDLAKKPKEDAYRLQVEEMQKKAQAAESLRLQSVQEFKEIGERLFLQEDISWQDLLEQKNSLEQKQKSLTLHKAERILLERLLKRLQDRVLELKSSAILELSEESQEKVSALLQLLEEKKARKGELKAQIEVYRKAIGGSHLDFEKAMLYREMMEAEKEALERISRDIGEIEEKLEELQG